MTPRERKANRSDTLRAEYPEDLIKSGTRGKYTKQSSQHNIWHSFLHSKEEVTDDFMNERASQQQPEREAF